MGKNYFDVFRRFVIYVSSNSYHEKEMVTIPITGEPLILTEQSRSSDSSITWTRDGIEYYIVSENITEDELEYCQVNVLCR